MNVSCLIHEWRIHTFCHSMLLIRATWRIHTFCHIMSLIHMYQCAYSLHACMNVCVWMCVCITRVSREWTHASSRATWRIHSFSRHTHSFVNETWHIHSFSFIFYLRIYVFIQMCMYIRTYQRLDVTCRSYAWVMSCIWMSHGTHMKGSRHTQEWVTSHM